MSTRGVLHGSVGRSGENNLNDVMLVKLLLNHNPGLHGSRPNLFVSGHCDEQTVTAIHDFQNRLGLHCGREGEVHPFGDPLSSLLGGVSHSRFFADDLRKTQSIQSPAFGKIPPVPTVVPLGGKTQKYTNDPQEVLRIKTDQATPAQVVDAVQRAWKELTAEGARLLVAQWMLETGSGKSCYNWNLGNLKALGRLSPASKYFFSAYAQECYSPKQAKEEYAIANGLASYPSSERSKANGWHCASDKVSVVFSAPHYQCRFYAWGTLDLGAIGWTDYIKRKVQAHPDMLDTLIKGDCDGYAKAAFAAGYFTGDPVTYANNLKSLKKTLERSMRPK